jgi:GTP cyclohydrolase III
MHKINEVDVKRFVAEMLANHLEYRAFQNEGIVYRHKADALYAVPAGLATTSNARVHNVIRNEEVGLELDWAIILGHAAAEGKEGTGRTHSTDQPRTAALKYSDSVNSRPLRIATESTTLKPRLSFPPGTL